MATRQASPIRATRPALRDWRGAGLYPATDSAAELDRRAAEQPNRAAVIDAVDGRVRDYANLADDVRRLAGALRVRGVGAGDVVSAQLPNWYETVVVIHAAARLGAVVNPIVPIYREREGTFILDQARPKVLFVPQTFRGFDHLALATRCAAGLDITVVVVRPSDDRVDIDGLGADTFAGLLAEDHDAEPGGRVEDIALLLYTSGTTADPKGVLHSHQTLGYEVRTFVEMFGLTADDAVFMPSPVTHITGLLFGAIMPVVTGCAVTLLDVWDAAVAVEAVQRDHCRFVMGATPFLHGMVGEHRRRGDSSELRVFVCGGADVPAALVREATEILDAHVARVYGSSEFPTLCCGGPSDDLRVRADTDGMLIGPALARIEDARADGVGELVVDGPELFLGYLDASLNEAAFTEDGRFRTGDLASIDAAGAITLHGRLKDIILRGGENISAREVEEALQDHPGVEHVAVVAMPDGVLVERVCAFVVVRAGAAEPTVADLGAFLETRGLARQKHPERVEILDELPITASGKVQKFILREQIRTEFDHAHQLMESR